MVRKRCRLLRRRVPGQLSNRLSAIRRVKRGLRRRAVLPDPGSAHGAARATTFPSHSIISSATPKRRVSSRRTWTSSARITARPVRFSSPRTYRPLATTCPALALYPGYRCAGGAETQERSDGDERLGEFKYYLSTFLKDPSCAASNYTEMARRVGTRLAHFSGVSKRDAFDSASFTTFVLIMSTFLYS